MADRQLRESPAGKARLHRAERCTLNRANRKWFCVNAARAPVAARCGLAGTGQTRKRSPALMPGFLLALYADQTDAYIRGEHYHAGYQQSIVTVSGHSLRS